MKMFETLLEGLQAHAEIINDSVNAKAAGKAPLAASKTGGRSLSRIFRQAISAEFDAVGRGMRPDERATAREKVEETFGPIWDWVKVYFTNVTKVLEQHEQRAMILTYWMRDEPTEEREKVWSVSRTYSDITFKLENELRSAVRKARKLGISDEDIARTFESEAPVLDLEVSKKRRAA